MTHIYNVINTTTFYPTLTIGTNNLCFDTDTHEITVHAKPIASFLTPWENSGTQNGDYWFESTSTQSNGFPATPLNYDFFWYIDDIGGTVDVPNGIHPQVTSLIAADNFLFQYTLSLIHI
mgnify:FL=1